MLPPFFEGIISWSGYRCNPCFPHGVEKNCLACGKVPLEGPADRRGLVARQGAESLRGAPARRGCGSPPRGQKPFLFLRKKKRFLTPKKKMGPVYGEFLVVHGGFRLYALFGDQPRPLRPCHWGTERRLWFYLAAAWLYHSRGRVRWLAGGVTHYTGLPLRCRGST